MPSTFSIVAYDSVTQEVGVAVQSKYFSVGTAVPWALAGAGAIATQASVNVSLGPKALALLKTGMPAPEVLKALAATDSLWGGRQVGIVDARGGAASWTGTRALDWAGGETGPGFARTVLTPIHLGPSCTRSCATVRVTYPFAEATT